MLGLRRASRMRKLRVYRVLICMISNLQGEVPPETVSGGGSVAVVSSPGYILDTARSRSEKNRNNNL